MPLFSGKFLFKVLKVGLKCGLNFVAKGWFLWAGFIR
jgi:hypothetical protein